MFRKRLLAATLLAAFWPAAGMLAADAAEPAPQRFGQAVFAFGGRSLNEDYFPSFVFFDAEYEDNTLVGLGYQRFFYEAPFRAALGVELGLAGRFGERDSLEAWGGLVGRYDGIVLLDAIRFSPAVTFGLSAVSDALPGQEETLERRQDADATLLFYVASEFNFSLSDHPEAEVFWRVHHRSGGWGTLGSMEGGSNANVLGLRFRF